MSGENTGLSWAPKLPSFSAGMAECSSKSQSNSEKDPIGHTIELVDGLFVPPRDPRKLNKLLKKHVKYTSGGSWFDMPAPTITSEIKKDLQILKLRNVIDPKRHYKKGDLKALTKYFQVGTVIESASDYYSSRLTKKERKHSLAEELLSDQTLVEYRKRKVQEIEDQRRPASAKKVKSKGRLTKKRVKERRL